MAKIVIAGKADCPYYARCELLADNLKINLPDFNLHKIVVAPNKWTNWLENTCSKMNFIWPLNKKGPIVWRELIDRGGKGLLIGGSNEFQEFARGYYDKESKLRSYDMTKIANENAIRKIQDDEEEAERLAAIKPLEICVTNAVSRSAYGIVPALCSSRIFGCEEVALRLFGEAEDEDGLDGIKMETIDLASSNLRLCDVILKDRKKAFENCIIVILNETIIQQEDEDKQDYFSRTIKYFEDLGNDLNNHILPNAKILVTGEIPVNLAVRTLIKTITKLSNDQIIGLVRTKENKAKFNLAEKLKVNTGHIADVVIWGNTTSNCYIDCSKAKVFQHDGAIWAPDDYYRDVVELIHDNKWLESDFQKLADSRNVLINEKLGGKASLAHSAAIIDFLTDWWKGSSNGRIYSAAIYNSKGAYDLPDDLVINMPIIFDPKGFWSIVEDFEMDEKKRNIILEICKELREEFDPPPKPNTPEPEPDSKEIQTLTVPEINSPIIKDTRAEDENEEPANDEIVEEEEEALEEDLDEEKLDDDNKQATTISDKLTKIIEE